MFDPGLSRPLPVNVRAVVFSGWGRPRDGRIHTGIDIGVPVGTPIWAMADGVATRVQATDRGDASGIYVALTHPSGLISRYFHLSRVNVAPNARVRTGQVIGYSGNTGIKNTGPHLHADLRAPAELLPAIEQAAGKPPTGWGPLIAGFGYGIPAEPGIPVDAYNARTAADAKANGIRLYTRPSLLQIGIAVAVGLGLWRLLR